MSSLTGKRVLVTGGTGFVGSRLAARLADEGDSLDTRQRSVYGRTKAESELRAMEAASQTGLELVVIRPGIIYGPGSYGWSRRMARTEEWLRREQVL